MLMRDADDADAHERLIGLLESHKCHLISVELYGDCEFIESESHPDFCLLVANKNPAAKVAKKQVDLISSCIDLFIPISYYCLIEIYSADQVVSVIIISRLASLS